MSEDVPEPPIRFTDNRKIDPLTGQARTAAGGAQTSPAADAASDSVPDDVSSLIDAGTDENAVLLEERTRDLQRVSAEYANYRKRADRDRLAAGELAVGRTLSQLLPVVDDLDRVKAHGDLSGALKAVADKLDAAFDKLGLVAFGELGDAFDPSIHEAVLHDESDTVDVATCTTIMRSGYRHGDRLLRPAMVGVTDPANPATATIAPAGNEGETTAEGDATAEADHAGTPSNTAETAAEGTSDQTSPDAT